MGGRERERERVGGQQVLRRDTGGDAGREHVRGPQPWAVPFRAFHVPDGPPRLISPASSARLSVRRQIRETKKLIHDLSLPLSFSPLRLLLGRRHPGRHLCRGPQLPHDRVPVRLWLGEAAGRGPRRFFLMTFIFFDFISSVGRQTLHSAAPPSSPFRAGSPRARERPRGGMGDAFSLSGREARMLKEEGGT